MLTRKEELFVKPFQQRLYHQHKVKLELATARVDTARPKEWNHIVLKGKKVQKERERCTQIVLDNCILWRHLGEITSNSRVDNHWKSEQPKFLHRVNLFKKNNKPFVDNEEEQSFKTVQLQDKVTKIHCSACNPNLLISKSNIPEERIPWDPPKKRLSKKSSTLSNGDLGVKNKTSEISRQLPVQKKTKLNSKIRSSKNLSAQNNITIETDNYLNYIEINEGSLDLVVKFPSCSKVSMIKDKTNHILQKPKNHNVSVYNDVIIKTT